MDSRDIDVLARPLRLPCGATLPNRIAKASTSEALATDHRLPHREHERLYARWAKGGAGLLVTGNVMVDPDRRVARGDVALHDGAPLAPFRAWASAAEPAKLWMQLGHPGRQSPRILDREPVAPSAVRLTKGVVVFARPRALSEMDIETVIRRFVRSAELAKEAGFAGIQIHAAHGYLLHQFLSKRVNLRADAWGGSAEKRRAMLLAIVRGVRVAVGAAFPIGVKIGAPNPDASESDEAEALDLVRALEAEAVDLVEISGGTYEHDLVFARRERSRSRAGTPAEAYFATFASRVKKAISTPLALTGGFRNVAAMAGAIESGIVDVIGLSRPLITDPDLPRRILAGESFAPTPALRPLGLRMTDAATELAWYTAEIRRIARGDEPLRIPSRVPALFSAVRGFLR